MLFSAVIMTSSSYRVYNVQQVRFASRKHPVTDSNAEPSPTGTEASKKKRRQRGDSEVKELSKTQLKKALDGLILTKSGAELAFVHLRERFGFDSDIANSDSDLKARVIGMFYFDLRRCNGIF
jgi:hypothetical protein